MPGIIHPNARAGYFAHSTPESACIAPFLAAGFDVSWSAKQLLFGSDLMFCLLKPDNNLKDSYGFEYEIVLAYSQYKTVEPRTFQAIDRFMRGDPARGRAESMLFFLVANDANLKKTTAAYLLENKEERIAVPLTISELSGSTDPAWAVRNAINAHYLSLDRYNYSLPLQEDTYFFGRQTELGELTEAIIRGENAGLFGLRKVGKTSLLLKAKRLLAEREGFHLEVIDCQRTAIRMRRWHQALEYIASSFKPTVPGSVRPSPWPEMDAADYFAEAVSRYLAHRKLKRVTFVFDEIDWIAPKTTNDEHWNRDHLAFWQTFRTLQTDTRTVNFIVAGLNPAVVELDRVDQRQNPLFGIVSPTFLGGLNKLDCDDMVRKIGKVMGLRFTDDALAYLHAQYAGHPLLTRMACSHIDGHLKKSGKSLPLTITEPVLKGTQTARDAELRFYCPHVVSVLEDFYPEAYQLLEKLAVGDSHGFISESKVSGRSGHLYKFGIVSDPEYPYVTYKVLEDYVAQENARKEGRATPYYVVPVAERTDHMRTCIDTVIDDIRAFEKLIRSYNSSPGVVTKLPLLFGPTSFPYAEQLLSIRPPSDATTFSNALVPLQRSFVESIDVYGASIGQQKYFWSDIKQAYPHLHESLHRIRVYRNDTQHLTLTPGVDQACRRFLERDLPDDMFLDPDKYWLVFQRTLDELRLALQREMSRLRT